MLFFGVCASLVHGICFSLYLLLFGRLTGTFAIQSFADHCQNEQSIIQTNQCPPGLQMNPLKPLYLNK